ncbi:MAG: hypothetical protein KGN75_02730 [Proteobacteria bacterium]|nr:hypothetical protein [Pseudomonadota bacterium]
MDKKTLYALTSKIFNTLKKLGIKPKIGVTTGIKRLPGSRNSFNTDLSKLEGGNPEALKKLIANDADFLPQATPDEIAQYNNNLEYLQSTFPDVFSKPQVVTEAKTGIKTVVDDVDLKSRKPTKEEYEEYSQILDDSENFVVQGNETFEELDALVKKQKDYEDFMYTQYKRGKLDPVAGEGTKDRMDFLRKKSEEAGMVGDRRLFTFDEMRELEDLERKFSPMGVAKNEISEAEMIKQKYGNIIDDNLLKQILIDDNPQRKAEVLASIDEAIKMQEKGIPYEEIINIIKNTTRTKQAKGGLIKNISYRSMFSDLDRTLNKGLGTMFKRKR